MTIPCSQGKAVGLKGAVKQQKMELVTRPPALSQPQHKTMLPPRGIASVRLPGLGMAAEWICHTISSQPGWNQTLLLKPISS